MAPDGNPRPNPRPPEDPSVYNVPTPEPARKPKGKTGWIKGLAAAIVFVALAFAFSRLIPGKPSADPPTELATNPPGNWAENVLMADPEGIDYLSYEEHAALPVFGSDIARQDIGTVTFLNTLAIAPDDAWDVSASGNGSVLAWAVPNGDLYDLHIAGNGGINGALACHDLFYGYSNVTQIDFGNSFHTEYAVDMSYMFTGCQNLRKLDLSSVNTGNVVAMSNIFYDCSGLTELNLSNFNTENITDMSFMFYNCSSLGKLDLSGFNTKKVTNMHSMFYSCSSLSELDLSSLNTENTTDMSLMFLVLVKKSGLDRQSAKIPSLEREQMRLTAFTPAMS